CRTGPKGFRKLGNCCKPLLRRLGNSLIPAFYSHSVAMQSQFQLMNNGLYEKFIKNLGIRNPRILKIPAGRISQAVEGFILCQSEKPSKNPINSF
ncbi:MAG TPA: hypothetical protein PKK05_24150, partial [Leptospiraceae bacterium]|nr:hypothetical protein [Leptospiraceae bacterium]